MKMIKNFIYSLKRKRWLKDEENEYSYYAKRRYKMMSWL